MINQFSYALRDLSRSYKKLFSIIITLFISLFILSLIINLETGLKKELQNHHPEELSHYYLVLFSNLFQD